MDGDRVGPEQVRIGGLVEPFQYRLRDRLAWLIGQSSSVAADAQLADSFGADGAGADVYQVWAIAQYTS